MLPDEVVLHRETESVSRLSRTYRAVPKPDTDADFCTSCAQEFGWRRRRHHCRNCGDVSCSDCLCVGRARGFTGQESVCKNGCKSASLPNQRRYVQYQCVSKPNLFETYEGGFLNGLWHGQGKLETALFQSYEGEFDNGCISGKGTCLYRSGEIFSGNWSSGVWHGDGVYTYRAGGQDHRMEGEWVAGHARHNFAFRTIVHELKDQEISRALIDQREEGRSVNGALAAALTLRVVKSFVPPPFDNILDILSEFFEKFAQVKENRQLVQGLAVELLYLSPATQKFVAQGITPERRDVAIHLQGHLMECVRACADYAALPTALAILKANLFKGQLQELRETLQRILQSANFVMLVGIERSIAGHGNVGPALCK